MARTRKSWVFWLGLFIFAMATVQIFTATQYIPSSNYGYIIYENTSQIVTGIAFVLVGLYMMYSGRNKPGSPAETVLI
jgi:hypothetical protein